MARRARASSAAAGAARPDHRRTRRVMNVEKDVTCPISTGRRTRRVQSVQEGGEREREAGVRRASQGFWGSTGASRPRGAAARASWTTAARPGLRNSPAPRPRARAACALARLQIPHMNAAASRPARELSWRVATDELFLETFLPYLPFFCIDGRYSVLLVPFFF